MSAKTNLKAIFVQFYRRLPAGLRDGVRNNKVLNGLRNRLFLGDTSLHDQYYSANYYATCDEGKWATDSAPYIASDIIEEFHPKDVIDVGCGLGEYIEVFLTLGVKAYGVELSAEAYKRCVEKGLEVASLDLADARELPWRADVVYSVEVAEHIHASGARNYVRLLTGAARRHIFMTAAKPGQPGLNHINCQPKSYWIKLLAEEGFEVDQTLIDRWEAANRDRPVASWFAENLMVFHRREAD
jgi:SAM-dependent methyltransferase